MNAAQKWGILILVVLIIILSLAIALLPPPKVTPARNVTKTPTPTPDPRSLQAGICYIQLNNYTITTYIAGYDLVYVEAVREGKYKTLFKGHDTYYWNDATNTGTRFYYMDVVNMLPEERQKFPGLFRIIEMRNQPDAGCERTKDISMSLFEIPKSVVFTNYTTTNHTR
jgi:hypothetical protein